MSPPHSEDRDDPASEDLRTLLDDLDRTLSSLRTELERRDDVSRREVDDRRRETRGRRERGPFGLPRSARPPGSTRGPRPPSVSELFRFTEEYTIPTVIAILETTIRSLELLRGVLRLADPDRSAFDRDTGSRGDRTTAARLGDGVTGLGRGAVSGVERALSELQTALSEADLPEDEPSRELLDEARRLSDEVADRLAEASERPDRASGGRRRDREWGGSERRSGAVDIDVTSAREAAGEGEPADGPGGEPPEVDVEAELASIKDEVERRSAVDSSDEDESTDADDSPEHRSTESDAVDGDNSTESDESDAT